MSIQCVDKIALAGKRVFCRVDFNVPLDGNQRVTDDTRVRKALPTIRHILECGATLVCASHLGRPKGKVVPSLSMAPVGQALSDLLGVQHPVHVSEEVVGAKTAQLVEKAQPGEVVLLENLRFEPGETSNDAQLAKALAELADVYINDAFGTAHRAHASTVGMIAHVKEKGAGFLMIKEIEMLGALLGEVERPFVAILGGAKVSDKIAVVESLLGRVNSLLIGGAMANTFIKAQGGDVGASRIEEDSLEVAKSLLTKAKQAGVEVQLPQDAVAAEGLEAAEGRIAPAARIPAGQMALDIGPETIATFRGVIETAKTLFWNGPMGVFERAPFAQGTLHIAQAVAASQAMSVVGGGDSVSAVNKSGVADRISHISTGGGASLEMMSGVTLPGVAVLEY